MLALEVTADIGGVVVVALVAVAFLGLVALLWRRTGRVETKLGSIEVGQARLEVGVDQVSRQVNHVEDPEREPTMRQLLIATREQSTACRAEVAAQRIELAASNRHQAETRRLLERHLAAHQAERDERHQPTDPGGTPS